MATLLSALKQSQQETNDFGHPPPHPPGFDTTKQCSSGPLQLQQGNRYCPPAALILRLSAPEFRAPSLLEMFEHDTPLGVWDCVLKMGGNRMVRLWSRAFLAVLQN